MNEKDKYTHDVAHEVVHEGHTINEMPSPVAKLEGTSDWAKESNSDELIDRRSNGVNI